jgi:hypothetical protein
MRAGVPTEHYGGKLRYLRSNDPAFSCGHPDPHEPLCSR